MDTTTPRSRGQRTTRLGLAALAVVTAVGVPAALAGLPAGGATVPPEPVPATATTATTATTYPGGGAEPQLDLARHCGHHGNGRGHGHFRGCHRS